MSKSISAVLWSPSLSEINGQSIVTRHVSYNIGMNWYFCIFNPGFFGILNFITVCFRLWWKIIAESCDMVYVVGSRSTLGFLRDIPALCAALIRKRVVVHSHGSDIIDLLKRPIIGRVAQFFYSRCELIVPSEHLSDPLRSLLKIQLHVVENFFISHAFVRPINKNPDFVILWNSNVMASKGIVELVEGVRIARQKGLAVVLVILGKVISDSELDRKGMEAWLGSIRREPWIDIRGPVSPEDAAVAVSLADVVALPSRYQSECQPLSIIQAMCSGCKVIVSDTPALRRTVGSYPAFICEGDAPSLYAAIVSASESSSVPTSAMMSAIDRFSVKRFDEKLKEIFFK